MRKREEEETYKTDITYFKISKLLSYYNNINK